MGPALTTASAVTSGPTCFVRVPQGLPLVRRGKISRFPMSKFTGYSCAIRSDPNNGEPAYRRLTKFAPEHIEDEPRATNIVKLPDRDVPRRKRKLPKFCVFDWLPRLSADVLVAAKTFDFWPTYEKWV